MHLLTVNCDDMVMLFSFCEHRLLPLFGNMRVAYRPAEKAVGLGKIPRSVDMFARRFQVQERLTLEVAEAISNAIAPRGVAVMCEADREHKAAR